MGQAVRKLKPPSVLPSESVIPKIKRQSVDIKPAPPEPQVIIEPDMAGEGSRPDPKFLSLSQRIVGTISTRPAGENEHPAGSIRDEHTRPMPTDRHTTLLTGPDEDGIKSPGTLNHTHIRELFLLYQGEAKGHEGPMDVESLATKFNVDLELLRRVLHYNTLVQYENPAESTTVEMAANSVQEVKETVRQFKGSEGLRVKKQPT